MPRGRRRISDKQLAREVQNLADEMPVRVRVSKVDEAKAQGYDEGYKQGVHDSNQSNQRNIDLLKGKFQEVVSIHERERAELIDEFSRAIFKLGVNSRGPQE